MTELQIVGLVILLSGALPFYLLAVYIEKGKHYSLFAGWNPSKISDEDAYGAMLCKGLRGFSIVMGLGCVAVFFNLTGVIFFVVSIVILPAIPLFYYILKAKKFFGK